MKAAVLTLSYLYLAYHVRSSRKKASSPILTRSACSVIAPRSYGGLENMTSGPGSAAGALTQNVCSGGRA